MADKNPPQVDWQQAFSDPETEIILLNERLNNNLPPAVATHFIDHWAPRQVQAVLEQATDLVEQRINSIERTYRLLESKESKITVLEQAKTIFEVLHPGTIAQEMKESLSTDILWQPYSKHIKLLEKTSTVGKLGARYQVPEKIVRGISTHCFSHFSDTKLALASLADSFKAYAQCLQDASQSKFGKGVALASGVVSSVALSALTVNPFVARKARQEASSAVGKWVGNKIFSTRVNPSIRTVTNSFHHFAEIYQTAIEETRKLVLVVISALYGNLLLRLEEDLNARELSLQHIDWENGTLALQLVPKKEEDIEVWAADAIDQLETLKAPSDWPKAVSAAETALQFFSKDSMHSGLADSQSGTSYAVIFARHRARALNKAADLAWEEKRYSNAAELYQHLLMGTSVAWENSARQDEAVHVAGWRLALIATMPGVSKVLASQALSFLPYIHQALVRQQDENHFLPGETVSEKSKDIAAILEYFSLENKMQANLTDRLYDTSENVEALWTQLSQKTFKPELIVNKYGILPQQKSGLSQWLGQAIDQRKKKQQRLIFGSIALVTIAVATCVLLAYR
jgi:hypothetical protein